ncbi:MULTISPECIES: thiol reductant ABC exporter subunit CydC [Brachybacterium]|uniref:Thiol reductant ABC exporter subunit CydC n=4 Tax=Brachybacterium TaxID=43668 RepID=A0A426SN66_9MICO|nr:MULTISPECIES: thiol reductant ABC exporter subunit CydC [Brachybacterium]MCT1436883.1 thiol reductant ABC exporter subunit CydC [Brachybacterium paraconglomeratum]RRR19496.1 thiol reductant ABC exporter subunit CydC [Brachybacterium paraconglomeratum]GLI31149.1 thiol reductant ABC exporter subunit CydC [Brachybacterium conglomeratum]GLK04061.1 thiol reductant ABC exporter subunit CydC [Brachybacterium conglomeratum]
MTAQAAPLRRAERALAIPPARLLAAVLAAVATLGSAFALAAVSAYLVTRAWTMPPVLDLTVAVVMVRALGVSRGVFRWLERMLTHDVALRGVVSLRTSLFTALASRTDDALTRLRRGELLSRLGDDAQELGDHVIKAIVPALVAAVMLVVVLATFAPLSLPATAAMAASLLLAAVAAPYFAHRAAALTEQALLTTRGDVTSHSLEILDDATSLRVDGRLDGALARLAAAQSAHDAAIDRAARPAAFAAAAVPASMVLAVTGSLLAAGAAWTAGDLSAGQIGILLLLPLSSFEAATALPAAATQHARSRAAAERLDALIGEGGGGDGSAPVPAERPATASLTARDLTAGWSPDAPCVRGLDLDLAPGSRLAVVGPSGSGKSTLLATLAGLLAPLGGEVSSDAASLREAVTMFAEDGHVFATTLRENLRVVRRDLSDDEALAALAAVGLDDWLATLPHGLETMLGPDGTTVSGGERRRLLLARAVVRRGPVLLLDEPTEHLDTARGDALLAALLTPGDESLVPASSTVVVVTHRPEAVPADTPVLRIGEPR